MTKVKVHIDTKCYKEKPKDFSTIKPRLQSKDTIQEIELTELIKKIKQGYSISPAIMKNGISASNWTEQSLFMVDIDNDNNDLPLLKPSKALEICKRNNLHPICYYFSFSHSKTKPKYRLVFLMNETITDTNTRNKIISSLIDLFQQSDSKCNNADRIFLGTNKEVVICDLKATINLEAINNISKTKHSITPHINEIPNGMRNNNLFIKACKLKEQGMIDSDISDLIQKENIYNCSPPLSSSEVDTLVKSAIKHVDMIPEYIIRTFDKNTSLVKYNVSSQLLAQYIRENANYFFVKDNAAERTIIFWYSDGVYKNISDDMLKGFIKNFITFFNINLYKSSIVNEVYKDLMTDLKFVSQDMLNSNENIINFKNGIYDISKKKLLPHTPSIFSTIQIPCNWNDSSNISAPTFEAFINRLTNGNEGTKILLLQFIGACISNIKGYRFKKALFMVGDGDTGKSQLKSLTERLLGKGNYTGIDLTELEERFGTSMLYNKRLAGSSDMSFISIKELKQFKKLTGGDSIFTEFKGYTGFDQVYNGLLWFCCNKLPKFSGDNGLWVYDRIIIIKCKNVIPKNEQDKHLLDKMYEERESIVKLALNELQKAIDNNFEFSISDEIKQESILYKKDNSTVASFIKDCCTERTDYKDGCTTKRFYDVYKEYCKDNNSGYAKTQKEFKEELMELSNLTEEKIIKRTTINTFYVPYTITPSTYKAYSSVYGYNEYFHRMKD